MGRVVHFEIHAADPDRAERFYRRVFDWEIQRWEGAPVDYRLITTGADGEPGINGAIVERRGAVDGTAVTAFVCTVSVDDLAAVEAAVPEAGGGEGGGRPGVQKGGPVSPLQGTPGHNLRRPAPPPEAFGR